MTKIRISEADIQRSTLDFLKKRGIMAWRNNTGMAAGERKGGKKFFIRYGTPGSPDIIAVIGGYFVGIELKGAGGRWEDDQKAFAQRLGEAGGIYLLAKSFDSAIEQIEDCIQRVNLKGRPIYQRQKPDGK